MRLTEKKYCIVIQVSVTEKTTGAFGIFRKSGLVIAELLMEPPVM